MKLTTLKRSIAAAPSRLAAATTQNLNPRPSGRRWQKTRERIEHQQGSKCADCGRLWLAYRDHVDHDVPRWEGGSDEDSNLRLRCVWCHEKKSKDEAARRHGG